MSFCKCIGKTANDCFECGKYYSMHTSHYDNYYNRRVIEFNCCIGENKIFEDNNDGTGIRLQ